jgi:hypothetical protein
VIELSEPGNNSQLLKEVTRNWDKEKQYNENKDEDGDGDDDDDDCDDDDDDDDDYGKKQVSTLCRILDYC